MKLFKKAFAALMVCAVSATMLTGCGMSEKQIEQYLKEKGYITRTEAASLYGGSSGGSSSSSDSSSQDLLSAINAELSGSNITVTRSEALDKKAQEYVDLPQPYDDEKYNAYVKDLEEKNMVLIASEADTTAAQAKIIAKAIKELSSEDSAIKSIGFVENSFVSQSGNFARGTIGVVVVAAYE